ncbi:MAG: TraB/GumN family protein [Defluviitaleaceae bacterium]|nr:TraB/GumN family protein [Defluviitaleaceae bacterium]
MKKIFAALLALIVFAVPVLAEIPTQTVGFVEYVQLRPLAESHGYDVDWDETYSVVILTSPEGEQYFVPTIDEPGIFIENGRVYILLVYAEAFFGLSPDAPPVNPGLHGMLTRVTHGENTAYIFGSMHTSRPHWFPLADIAEAAMRRADVFAFEVDMLEMFDLSGEQIQAITEMRTLPDGKTLEDILSPEDFEYFLDALETYAIWGITYERVKHLTPIALFSTISEIAMTLLGADPVLSVDLYISNFADERDLPIIGLNTIMREVELMFDIPLEIQAETLVGFPDFQTLLAGYDDIGLLEIYEAQDIETIRELLRLTAEMQELDAFTRYRNHIDFYVRCNIFADEIARLLTETDEPTTFFVTVGIAHIVGCCGSGGGIVLQLLRDMDFAVVSLWEEES